MLKQLIQRLLDSRTTPKEAGHSAMPTTPEITSQSFAGPFSSWGPVASGTASEDGYIYAAGAVATSGSNSEFRLDNGQFGSYITSTWGTQGLLLPVMKGQSWRLYATNRKDVVIRLYRLVGGGYNFFVRRALLCLRALSNYLPRSFCKINIPTLLINADQVPVHKARQSQETARRISWLHSQVGLSLRLAQKVRQTTHGLGLKTPPEELHTSPMQFANTKRLLSQCKKEIFLLLTSALITRTKALFCLSLLKQQNNFGTGGALC